MSDRCSNLLDFQWHQYVSWRSFAYSNITICDCTPSKPHSTSMISLVVLTRTWLNMLNWEFLNLNIVYNGCKTYHVLGKACFSMVFNGFPWFSMAFRMMALQFLLVRFGSSHIRFGSFYLGRCFWCNGVNIVVLTVGSFSIVVACNASNMNQQRKRMVLVVINGNVVLGHAPTCSTLRCVKFTNDHASVLIPPRLTSGLLFLRMFFRQFSDRCSILLISNWISMCCEAPFRLAASLYGHYVLCKPHSTSMEAQ